MSAPRQQRSPNWRGQAPIQNRRTTGDLEWSLASVVGNVITLTLSGVSGVPQKVGEPQWSIPEDPSLTFETNVIGSTLVVTSNLAPPASFTLRLGPLDPGVRTNSGAYLACGDLACTNPFPIETQVTWALEATPSTLVAQVTINTGVTSPSFLAPAGDVIGRTWIVGAQSTASQLTILNGSGAGPVIIPPGGLVVFVFDGSNYVPTTLI